MIKTFHEAPKSIFKIVQSVTDGDYALVNLLDDPEYYQLFKDAIAAGREVILDNGVFELGEAFDSDVFADWVKRLKPTYYIVPDVLDDGVATVNRFFEFLNSHPGLPGRIIGVAQGKSYKDLVNCYHLIEPHCDKVAISFNSPWYIEEENPENVMEAFMYGRQRTLMRLVEDGVINKSKKHHLLGVALPQEMVLYGKMQAAGMCQWIDSVDTSNPVVHGLYQIKYAPEGLPFKRSTKLYTMIDQEVNYRQMDCIEHNIHKFRRFCNGLV